MKHTYHFLCLTITAFVLAACGVSQYYASDMQTGIDGQWVDENGIISSFRNGVFETHAADTKEKLSEGTYNYISAQRIEIEMRSILRGTISQVSCTMSNDATQLLCTSYTGSQFFLKRKF